MKKLVSLLFAVVSTMFLFAGVASAAEKFDGLARISSSTTFADSVMDGPGTPTNFVAQSAEK